MLTCLNKLPAAFVVLAAPLFVQPWLAADESSRQLFTDAQGAARQGQHRRAISQLDQILTITPHHTDALYLRGREHFRAGQMEQSFDDFERLVELKPELKSRLWERGITCYYAEKYREGVAQFESYQDFDDNDVENAVWHFLCLARLTDLENARQRMLRTRPDPRLPMQAVYELYAGKRSTDSVLAAADRATDPGHRRVARFYAHLYVGLYFDAQGQPKQARPHVEKAATSYRISHYMGDVAEVHAKRLADEVAPADPTTRTAPASESSVDSR